VIELTGYCDLQHLCGKSQHPVVICNGGGPLSTTMASWDSAEEPLGSNSTACHLGRAEEMTRRKDPEFK